MHKGVIYKYTFPNGKVYIGQTINPRSRKQQHLSEKTGARNVAFWRAYKKYGTYQYEEIETIKDDDKQVLTERLNDREQHYIALYDSMNPQHGYNLTSGGKVCVISEEAKQRMSDARTDKVAVLQYDLDGNFIAEYESTVDAAKAINSHAASVHACCTGHRGRSRKKSQIVKGFTFRFKSDLPDVPQHIDLTITSNKKAILQYTTKGEFVREWESATFVERETGISSSGIRSCIAGNVRQAGGFMWREKEGHEVIPQKIAPIRKANYTIRFTPDQIKKGAQRLKELNSLAVLQFGLDGKFIAEFPSLKEAGDAYGGDRGTICSACKHKKSKSAYGFQWRYKSEIKNPEQGIPPCIKTKQVKQLTESGEVVYIWNSIKEAAQGLGIKANSIYYAVSKPGILVNGFIWKYTK